MFGFTDNDSVRVLISLCFLLSAIVKFIWAIAGLTDAKRRYQKWYGYYWECMLSSKLLVGSFLYLYAIWAFGHFDFPMRWYVALLSYLLAGYSVVSGYMWLKRRYINPDAFDPIIPGSRPRKPLDNPHDVG